MTFRSSARAFLLSLAASGWVGSALAQDLDAALSQTFPAPDWRTEHGRSFCISSSCGKGSFVRFERGIGIGADQEIRADDRAANEDFLLWLASSYIFRDRKDITLIKTSRDISPHVASMKAAYKCRCSEDNGLSRAVAMGVEYGAIYVIAKPVKGSDFIVMTSMAHSLPEAERNLRQLEEAATASGVLP